MAKYVVIRTADRETCVVGKTNTKEEAQEILRNDFEKWFWQKVESSADKTFEEVYKEYAGDECLLTDDDAWLNNCNHYDFDWLIIDATTDDVLKEPLSMKQIILSTTEEIPYVKGNVIVEIAEIINCDLDDYFDMLSERLTGSPCLMDINCKAIDVTEDGASIIVHVSGDASEIIELDDEMFEELKSALFMEGEEALEDFTDMDLSRYDDKDVIDNILDQVSEQMPDEEQIKFYRKYVK